MNADLISVLVPVFNAGDWLQNCLESIAAQSYETLEAILVDDGSTDGSPELCEQFCRRDARFRLIRQENHGVSSARNKALDAARGQYVFFMDADDYLAPQALQLLHDAIRSGPYDMATGEYRSFGSSGVPELPERSIDRRTLSGADCVRECFLAEMHWRVVWNHLIPRALIGDLRFESVFQEDALFNYRLFRRMGQTIVVDEPTYYYYLNRPGSLSKTPGYLSEETFLAVAFKMFDMTPAEDTASRAWMLTKFYRHFILDRCRMRKEGDANGMMATYRQFLQKTQQEYFSHPDIPFVEKCLFRFLRACPWLVWILMKVTRNL